jgi:hypothetical protein
MIAKARCPAWQAKPARRQSGRSRPIERPIMIGFYRTPLGAKSLHEMPRAMAEFASLLMPRLQDLQMQTRQRFEKILREHGYVK